MSVLAASILLFRTICTATETGPLTGAELASVVLALVAAALAFTGAAIGPRSGRRAALPIGGALLIELLFLNELAPPRLIAAIPLFFALALALVPTHPEVSTGGDGGTASNVVPGIALALMVPVGIAFITTGLVAPQPDVFGAYALFGLLLTIAVSLAVRRSRWVAAMPFVSAASWVLMIWLGERFLNWSA